MKTKLLGFFFAAVISLLSLDSAIAASHGGAHLIVQRSADFGNGLGVHLAIDGRIVANIDVAHRYEGNLSAGGHTLTVEPRPNPQQVPPTSVHVNLRSGRANIYVVGWSNKKLVIRPTSDNIPAVPAPPAAR